LLAAAPGIARPCAKLWDFDVCSSSLAACFGDDLLKPVHTAGDVSCAWRPTQVLVASIGSGLQGKRMEIASLLWDAGIAVRQTLLC